MLPKFVVCFCFVSRDCSQGLTTINVSLVKRLRACIVSRVYNFLLFTWQVDIILKDIHTKASVDPSIWIPHYSTLFTPGNVCNHFKPLKFRASNPNSAHTIGYSVVLEIFSSSAQTKSSPSDWQELQYDVMKAMTQYVYLCRKWFAFPYIGHELGCGVTEGALFLGWQNNSLLSLTWPR